MSEIIIGQPEKCMQCGASKDKLQAVLGGKKVCMRCGKEQ